MEIVIDKEGCTGYGTCVGICPEGVLEIGEDEKVYVTNNECTECKACEVNCEYNAIRIMI